MTNVQDIPSGAKTLLRIAPEMTIRVISFGTSCNMSWTGAFDFRIQEVEIQEKRLSRSTRFEHSLLLVEDAPYMSDDLYY